MSEVSVSWVDVLFWWAGACVCISLALSVGIVVLSLACAYIKGIALSVDWHIWIIKCSRLNGIKVKWRHLPESFIKRVRYMPGNPDTIYTAIGGKWRGFRDWTATKEDAENG